VISRDDIRAARRQPRTLAIQHHRPFPLPDRRPWLMGQTWHDLLFAHWAIDPAVLRPVVHPSIPIDTWEGKAWIGITPFGVQGLHPRRLPPLPGGASFPELNVRTYSALDGRPGIHFLSLDAASWPAVFAARRVYRLPYFRSRMAIAGDGDRVSYISERLHGPPAAFRASYGPTGPARAPVPGSLEYWLAERYCLYTVDASARVLRADIHHPPWPVAPAEATIEHNTMLAPYGIDLPGDPLLHFARRQDVLIWPLTPA
jgi:uncharacterized protein YqjF (DUF2071 family)